MRGTRGETHLFLAFNSGKRDVEKLLLERGADMDQKYKDEKMRLARMYKRRSWDTLSGNSITIADRHWIHLPGKNCIKIGLPGKLILRYYSQENRTSRRPFLLLRIGFPGRLFLYNCLQGCRRRE